MYLPWGAFPRSWHCIDIFTLGQQSSNDTLSTFSYFLCSMLYSLFLSFSFFFWPLFPAYSPSDLSLEVYVEMENCVGVGVGAHMEQWLRGSLDGTGVENMGGKISERLSLSVFCFITRESFTYRNAENTVKCLPLRAEFLICQRNNTPKQTWAMGHGFHRGRY